MISLSSFSHDVQSGKVLYRQATDLLSARSGLAGRTVSLELGIAVEPVVELMSASSPDRIELYGECLGRLLIDDQVELRGGAFVAVFEAAGVVGVLDELVLERVLQRLRIDPAVQLGCNISPYTLADPLVWECILNRIGAQSDLATRLTLEITESAPLDAIEQVAERLGRAKALGVRLALDDFGTGFAVGGYLRNVDVDWDIVKVDRSFLGDLRKTSAGRRNLASMVAMASDLAPVIVVEGIETEAHLAAARGSGARFGQGWLFEEMSASQWHPVAPEVTARFVQALQQKDNGGSHLNTCLSVMAPVGDAGQLLTRPQIDDHRSILPGVVATTTDEGSVLPYSFQPHAGACIVGSQWSPLLWLRDPRRSIVHIIAAIGGMWGRLSLQFISQIQWNWKRWRM
ncbi:EAL domain-containing protein [Brucella gallinifaecis]|uniref:EAL domain-containing protein n=1 Tax=Brucella gallinifaecis TaxID=215590 RepID=A0A502BL66_9HYPH|nr:EAL domain-containing protein [Brucella gallinifaecis]TPF74391.1 EAL domain-containing protein [Brucella gallinifaecis]